ncbi:cora-domain-containing protein [Venturia nashicola]|nr:cora-domain-containing protein [Venturia nashicola]
MRRFFSTNGMKTLWHFLGFKRNTHPSPARSHELPPLASFLDDNQSAGRLMKPTNELRLRCTEFDEFGNVTLVNGEFKKSELIAKYGLLPRDLRKIDSSLLPHILIRPEAILLNLLHLRVLIKHNRVLVFNAYGSTDSYTQSVFMYDLEGKLRQMDARSNGSLPYEFRALEAVLISCTTGLESEFEGVRDPVVRVLRELEEDIDRDKLRYLLVYSKRLGTFEQKARLVRDALDELLEADDDLADMYLTEKTVNGKGRSEQDHTEVEMLLESYHKVADEIVQAAENLVSNIRNTEEIVKAILDANRNSLMLLELRFSICTLGLGAGTFLAALYGMNLKNFMEESDFGFWGISIFSTLIGGVVLIWGLKVLRRVQRVSMWGHQEADRGSMIGRNRGNLPPLPPLPPLPQKIKEKAAPIRAAVEAGKAARKSATQVGHHHNQGQQARRRKLGERTWPTSDSTMEGGLGNTPTGLGAKPSGGANDIV